ncbi:MAG: hypothetical protein V2A62_01790 [Candidatus Woesearchaeota archaeon]
MGLLGDNKFKKLIDEVENILPQDEILRKEYRRGVKESMEFVKMERWKTGRIIHALKGGVVIYMNPSNIPARQCYLLGAAIGYLGEIFMGQGCDDRLEDHYLIINDTIKEDRIISLIIHPGQRENSFLPALKDFKKALMNFDPKDPKRGKKILILIQAWIKSTVFKRIKKVKSSIVFISQEQVASTIAEINAAF